MKFNLLDPKLDAFPEKLGGKARNLRILKSWGLPVPDAFVLTENGIFDLATDIAQIGGFPVAVRSSGALEDLEGASFAGLYDTFLFVNSHEELKVAITKCFDSKNSHRVNDYLKQKNIQVTGELQMSVVVQKMIDPQIAGVLFTLNPLNGREEEIYLEFCEGVGEKLVSGLVTPSRVTYNWFSDEVTHIEENEGAKISQDDLQHLISLSLEIQEKYGQPQDIEWAIDKSGKVYILQARPITSFNPRDDCPELTNADFKDGGISARVCSRFMYSVYREALDETMGGYLKKIGILKSDEGVQWLHGFYGRAYWNSQEVKNALKRLPGFEEEAFDRDLGIQKDYGESGPIKTSMTIAGIVDALPILMGMYREFIDCENMISVFRESFEIRDSELKESTQNFGQWFLKVILFQRETEQKYFRTIYNNSSYQSEFKNFLKKLKGYETFDEVYLLGELDGISHIDVQSDLAVLKEFEGKSNYLEARKLFLEKHYHHGNCELDLTVPRWGEDPRWVDELVKNFSISPKSNDKKWEKISQKISEQNDFITRYRFKRFLARSRQFLRLREEMRAFSTRAYYLLRKGILEFASREGIAKEDIFMIDINEIIKKLENPNYKIASFAKNKSLYQSYRNFNPPNEFGGMIMKSAESSELRGLGCSHGEKIGRARIILDIEETGSLTKEDILITKFTDPGWTPVLARVGGVVTEVGGLLSHAAVIGREYGIPAILNFKNATKIIQDGSLIKINGKTGEVTILEESAKS